MSDLTARAEALEEAGQSSEALEVWRAAVARDPAPESMARLGRLCLREGRVAEGEQLLREVISKHPSRSDAYFYLGTYYKEHGDIDEARELLEKSVQLDEWAPALVALGHVYRRLKMKDAASRCFERATVVDPSESEAWFGLGVMSRFVDGPRAIQLFRKAIALDADNNAAFRELEHMLWRTGQYDAARESIVRALQLNESDPWAHDYLGTLLVLDDRDEEAELSFRRAIALWPDVPLFHCNLGDVLVRLDRMKEAESAYKQALALDTSNSIANRRMGQFYREIGHYEKAKMYLTRAIQSDPSDRQAREALAAMETSKP